MNSESLISVVVPYYKTDSESLKNCIQSIVCQTYMNIEILIIDDGSGDEYTSLLEEIKSTDSRIKLYRKKNNGGLSSARNYGLQIAEGEYVIFIDSDDIIHKDTLTNLCHSLLHSGSDLAIGELVVINDYSRADYLSDQPIIEKIYDRETALEKSVAVDGFGATACGRLARRKMWLSNGDKPFLEGVLHEDLASTWRILKACRKVSFIRGRYYYYYQGASSSIHTGKVSSKFCQDYYDALHSRNMELIRLYPQMKRAIAYSYLVNCPNIYFYISDSNEKKALSGLKKQVKMQFNTHYIEGLKYHTITKKQMLKYTLFRISPWLYGTLYKTIRRLKGYRC